MALAPITNSSIPAIRSGEPTAARAAQRAFFNAALGAAGAPQAVAPTAAVTASPEPSRNSQARSIAAVEKPDPARTYRPGSLLDIKV